MNKKTPRVRGYLKLLRYILKTTTQLKKKLGELKAEDKIYLEWLLETLLMFSPFILGPLIIIFVEKALK